MTRKECYQALGLREDADLAEVKRAYRRLAFSLHPDLNPDVPDAAKRFQRLNQAYVHLSRTTPAGSSHSPGWGAANEASQRAKEDAKKAYDKARQGQEESSDSRAREADPPHEDMLKDILNDSFARRVFEDIYSHIQREDRTRKTASTPSNARRGGSSEARKAPRPSQADFDPARTEPAPSGVAGKLKGWLRRQIDDEQVLRLPGESLVPGARVRLQIRYGLSDEPQTIELTLPPEFVPGKPLRLKGMGRRLGNWKGDLYVRIEPV